jgi:polar amino acid transport system substrate-binding protein
MRGMSSVGSARLAVGLVLALSLGAGGGARAASLEPGPAQPSPSATAAPGPSPDASAAPAAITLRAVSLEGEPFAMRDGDDATGYSIELWDEIALRAGIDTELTWVDDVDDLLEAVRSGAADVGVGPVSMTPERERDLDFTYAYSTGGLGIMVASAGVGPVEAFIDTVFRPGWLLLGGVLAVLIIAVGVLIWLVRRGREEWPTDARTAFHEGAWRSARVFLNSSFGEHEPRSGFGRLVAILWIVAGIVFTSLFTAAVTSTATVSRLQSSISGPGDLAGKRILSLPGTTSADWLTERGLAWRRVDYLESAYQDLLDGKADAIVFDQLTLRYDATVQGGGRLAVVGPAFELDPYGFALTQDGAYREAIDTALLSMIHDGSLDALHTIWFGATT